MDVVLVPGAWLDGSCWDAVVPRLESAGHRASPLTLPGMERAAEDRAQVRLADQVAAVVAAIDAADGAALLVGHSIGSGIAHQALDARPDRVSRIVHVGGFPSPDGAALLPGLAAVDGEVAMPDWAEVGEEANVRDFDRERLARFYAEAIPQPEHVCTDPVRLTDDRRLEVPATMVCPEYSAVDLRSWVEAGEVPEVAALHHVDYVDIGGGHWPQLTQPDRLARVLIEVASRGLD
ncbi:alpha/beta hydrolase [Nocardioides bigeumensis]|uniref:Alpha/beta hydrolase n=1 Tax=Nocardioides bigeumensis TaxID=433657 RepID=A0ABP5JEI1_9ACTN